MTLDALLVTIIGAAVIGWINWYFFVAPKPAAQAAVARDGHEEVTIVVRGGYAPARVTLRVGRPVRLVFDRRETSGCSEEVVFPALGIRRFLPAHARTVVDTGALAAGTYEFTCGMGMLRGALVVE